MSDVPSAGMVGGQAVIEGVMMRSKAAFVVAVRKPDGTLLIRERPYKALAARFAPMGWPFVRGVVSLVETLAGGLDALTFSAEVAEGRHGSDGAAAKPASRASTALSVLLSLGLALGLFVGAPHGLTMLVAKLFDGMGLDSIAFHATAGVLKLAIFIGYLSLLSRLEEVRRLFQFHGAEHKAIATYEAGLPLEVEHARKMTTFHARCGTSFVLLVVVASIVVFSLVIPSLGLADDGKSHLLALAIKVPLLLPVSALAYELNRWAARRIDRRWVQALVAPGFLLQRLTTREPEDEMLEVALASLRAALALDKKSAATVHTGPWVLAGYRDFADLCRVA